MFRDEDQFPAHTATVMEAIHRDEMTRHEQRFANDDFDDVFGSALPSPTFSHENENADLAQETRIRSGNLELSDIPRLKEKHETEGYRDGVTKGKAESVQKGFDEGYSLGAVLGLRIGKILGLLEGISGALKGGGEAYKGEAERVEGLLGTAKGELGTKSVFLRGSGGARMEFGVFEVPGEGDGMEVTFPDVAGAHPLVAKWERVIEEEVEMWGLDLDIMEGEHAEEEHMDEGAKSRQDATRNNRTTEVNENTEGLAKVMGVAKKDLNW